MWCCHVFVHHKLVLYWNGWKINLIFGTEATLGLSCIVLEGNWVISKNKNASLWNFDPNSELRNAFFKFHYSVLVVTNVVSLFDWQPLPFYHPVFSMLAKWPIRQPQGRRKNVYVCLQCIHFSLLQWKILGCSALQLWTLCLVWAIGLISCLEISRRVPSYSNTLMLPFSTFIQCFCMTTSLSTYCVPSHPAFLFLASIFNPKSFLKSFWKSVSPPLMVDNALINLSSWFLLGMIFSWNHSYILQISCKPQLRS